MKGLLKTLILLGVGIVMIPALYALAITLFGTMLGFIANPKVMLVLIAILAVICTPGMIIAWFVKK